MTKHLFIPLNPESPKIQERKRCVKCGRGESNDRHLNASINVKFHWLFSEVWS